MTTNFECGSHVSERTRDAGPDWIGAERWPLLIVTGSRAWRTPTAIWRELSAIADASGGLRVVVGDCRSGADAYTRGWCRANVHRCRWVQYRAEWWRHGRAARPKRNQRMVSENRTAVECLAFPLPDSVGTRHCMVAAARAGIPVREIRWEPPP